MKKSLLLALLSTSAMFAYPGHGVSHSSHISHSSHVSHHSSSHSSGSHTSPHSSGVHTTPMIHSTPYEGTASHPYHQTGNITTSHVTYHPTKKFFYYPIMNHHTKSYDTIKGKTAKEVQHKVNNYIPREEPNWVGITCLIVLVFGIVAFIAYSYKE